MRNAPIPFGVAKQKYATSQPGTKAAFVQPLYDYQAYASAGQTSLSFFQTPIGQSGKTAADTNLTMAGQLSKGQTFLLQGIEVDFIPGDTVLPAAAITTSDPPAMPQYINDVNAALRGGWLDLTILDKNWLRDAPLRKFPPSRRLGGAAAVGIITTDAATNHLASIQLAQSVGEPYELAPLWIDSNTTFAVTLNWPTAIALPSGVAGRIGVNLIGTLYRDVV